ncbi:MAG: KpsF/GutQ family sugar-phosphate isomerase [Holosporales bacterium]|jgi:arabinose-5-phosphate isomerase|nr:KpsF/GutQ family sugar-phosphate isomerase [Holosporales bacterium]
MDYISEAKKTIIEEAKALELLAEQLPSKFSDAVELILNSKGRLVVSGIGKSGHIGRKISATMSSLGQKSFFLHPSEASHGDLGMLDEKDVLLLISYSGETIELLPVLEFAKRVGIKIVSISKNDKSTLSENSDICLKLPNVKEACLGIAPTVSSTITLALGDALAVALSTRRGFSPKQFKAFHPGGALGKKLSFVFDAMHKEMPLLQIGSYMRDAVVVMSEGRLGCVGITGDRNELLGMITDGDLRRHMSNGLLLEKVEEVMTVNPIVIDKNLLLSEVLSIMENKKITNVFVVDDKKTPIGIIHLHDIITKKII